MWVKVQLLYQGTLLCFSSTNQLWLHRAFVLKSEAKSFALKRKAKESENSQQKYERREISIQGSSSRRNVLFMLSTERSEAKKVLNWISQVEVEEPELLFLIAFLFLRAFKRFARCSSVLLFEEEEFWQMEFSREKKTSEEPSWKSDWLIMRAK